MSPSKKIKPINKPIEALKNTVIASATQFSLFKPSSAESNVNKASFQKHRRRSALDADRYQQLLKTISSETKVMKSPLSYNEP